MSPLLFSAIEAALVTLIYVMAASDYTVADLAVVFALTTAWFRFWCWRRWR